MEDQIQFHLQTHALKVFLDDNQEEEDDSYLAGIE